MQQLAVPLTQQNTLTAIVPVHQMEGELGLLESWICDVIQLPIEIRLVFDESNDRTLEELNLILRRVNNKKILLYQGRFGSPGSARNAALSEIKTKWVTFWDSDDLPLVNQVLKVCKETAPNVEIIICNYSSRNYKKNHREITGASSNSRKPSIFSIIKSPGIWRWVFRADLIANTSFTSFRVGEDQCLLASVLSKSPKIERRAESVYIYSTNRMGSITNSRYPTKDLKLTMNYIWGEISKSNIRIACILFIVEIRILLTYIKKRLFNHA